MLAKQFLAYLFFCAFSSAPIKLSAEASSPKIVANALQQEDLLIAHAVSPLLGQMQVEETLISFPQNIYSLKRVYQPVDLSSLHELAPHITPSMIQEEISKQNAGWQFFRCVRAEIDFLAKEVVLPFPEGYSLRFSPKGFDQPATLKSALQSITNHRNGVVSPRFDPRNIRIDLSLDYRKKVAKIIALYPDGTQRYYNSPPGSSCAYLQKEEFPNKKVARYKYNPQNNLTEVVFSDQKETCIDHWIKIANDKITSSINKTVGYIQDMHRKASSILIAPDQQKHLLRHNAYFLLETYTSLQKQLTASYSFDPTCFAKVDGLYFDPQKTKLYAKFSYPSPLTTKVEKYDGSVITFTFTPHFLLSSIVHSYHNRIAKKQFHYDASSRLSSLEIWDNQQLLQKCSYIYDDQNHAITRIIEGPVSSELPEKICTKYFYSQDGRNLLLKKISPRGKITRYEYEQKGFQLIAKYNKYDHHILRRTFYHYDDFGNRTKKIVDDAAAIDPHSTYQMTHRTTTNYQYKNTPPHRHALEKKEVVCSDGKNEAVQSVDEYQYDSLGHLIYHNHNGNVTYKKYNAFGYLIEETLPQAEPRFYEYNSHFQREKIRRGEETISYRYDVHGRRIEKNNNGACVNYVYDLDHRITQKTKNDGRKVFYHYDPLHQRLVKKSSNYGASTHYVRNALGHLTKKTDGNSNVTNYFPNIFGKPYRTEYPDHSIWHFSYDHHGNLTKKIRPDLREIHYIYDIFDRKTTTEMYASGKLLAQKMRLYSTFFLLGKTDFENRKTLYHYNLLGQKIQKNVAGKITSYAYHPDQRKKIIETGQTATHITYDLDGHVLQKTVCDTQENCLRKKTYQYDLQKRRVKKILHDQDQTYTTTWHYDNLGRIIAIKSPTKTTHIEYESQGMQWEKITHHDDGKKTIESFTPQGKIASYIAYNKNGKILEKWQKTYDILGRETMHVDHVYENGHHVNNIYKQYERNCRGDVTLLRLFPHSEDEQTIHFHYDWHGNIVKKVLPDKTTLWFTYDDFHHLSSVTSSDQLVNLRFTFDKTGLLTEAEDLYHKTKTTLIYDQRKNLVSEITPFLGRIERKYDLMDRLVGIDILDRLQLIYEYNALELKKVFFIKDGKKTLLRSYEKYNPFRKPVSETLPWDLGTITHHYDGEGRLQQMKTPFCSIPTILKERNSSIIPQEKEEYCFNSLGTLLQKKHLSLSSTLDGKITQCDGVKFYYDEMGRRIQKVDQGLYTSYHWDALGRLIEIHTPHEKFRYIYDALGRRVKKKTSRSDETYVFDFDQEIMTISDQGEVALLPAPGGSIVGVKMNQTLLSAIQDPQKSIIYLLNHQKKCINEYSFGLLGESTSFYGDTTNPYRFHSAYYDDNLQLLYDQRNFYGMDSLSDLWLGALKTQYPICIQRKNFCPKFSVKVQ